MDAIHSQVHAFNKCEILHTHHMYASPGWFLTLRKLSIDPTDTITNTNEQYKRFLAIIAYRVSSGRCLNFSQNPQILI